MKILMLATMLAFVSAPASAKPKTKEVDRLKTSAAENKRAAEEAKKGNPVGGKAVGDKEWDGGANGTTKETDTSGQGGTGRSGSSQTRLRDNRQSAEAGGEAVNNFHPDRHAIPPKPVAEPQKQSAIDKYAEDVSIVGGGLSTPIDSLKGEKQARKDAYNDPDNMGTFNKEKKTRDLALQKNEQERELNRKAGEADAKGNRKSALESLIKSRKLKVEQISLGVAQLKRAYQSSDKTPEDTAFFNGKKSKAAARINEINAEIDAYKQELAQLRGPRL